MEGIGAECYSLFTFLDLTKQKRGNENGEGHDWKMFIYGWVAKFKLRRNLDRPCERVMTIVIRSRAEIICYDGSVCILQFPEDGTFFGMEREGENVGNNVGPTCIILSYVESSLTNGDFPFFFLFVFFIRIYIFSSYISIFQFNIGKSVKDI